MPGDHTSFERLIRGRFGWVNASYVFGLTIVTGHMRRALGTLTPWDTFYNRAMLESEVYSHGETALDDSTESGRGIGHMESEAAGDGHSFGRLQETDVAA